MVSEEPKGNFEEKALAGKVVLTREKKCDIDIKSKAESRIVANF